MLLLEPRIPNPLWQERIRQWLYWFYGHLWRLCQLVSSCTGWTHTGRTI